MKIKQILAALTILPVSLLVSTSRADDFNAVQSGNWSDTNTWVDNTTLTNAVPGINDDADIPSGIDVTVDTNISVGFIYDYGTVTMGTNSSLNLFQDQAIATTITLDTTAAGNTVIYSANPFFALQTNYYNLVFATTNYVQPIPPYGSPWEDFNNFSSSAGPTPMSIAGDWTLMGAVKVQQGSGGAPITVDGNLIIGAGCAWDCSGDVLTVVSNAYVYGLLEDLNGSLGTNYIGGNVIVAGASTSIPSYPASGHNPAGPYTNGWYVSDITTWGVGGGLTNDGAIYGLGFGSIIFDGATGIIAGTNMLTIPTVTINGNYAIGTSITLITNTPTLNGTLVFDIANPKQITLLTNAGTALYYSGNLNVINSGPPPASGTTYQLFNSTNGYAGSFSAANFPSLPAGLSWVDNTLTSGSIAVAGTILGSPTLTLSRNGGVLTLSWDSTTFPGYSVQGQTNSAGIHSNWGPTGSGPVSPFMIVINPTNPPVFFRLSNP